MKGVRLAVLGMTLILIVACQWFRPEPEPQTFTVSSFAWLPGSEGLVVAKDVGGEQRLWLVGAPQTGARRLTNGEHAELDPAVSQDGRYIAFVGYTAEANHFLALYDRTTKATVKLDLELSGANPVAPVFSPDGRFLAVERVYGAADAHSDVYQDILLYDLREKRVRGVLAQGDTNRLLGFSAAPTRSLRGALLTGTTTVGALGTTYGKWSLPHWRRTVSQRGGRYTMRLWVICSRMRHALSFTPGRPRTLTSR